MSTTLQHPRFYEISYTDRVYSPDILPRLQSLLADLADIDFACEQKLKVIERGLGDDSLKRKKIAQLWQDHQKRREPYIAALEAMEEQIRGCFE